MRLVPFEIAHGEALLEADLNDDRNRPAPEFGNFMPTLVHEGMAFTGIDNGHLIGAAGIFPLWQGVGEAWFLGASRVGQAAMRSDWPELKRWARFLGMEHEGHMPMYGANKLDYERYAKTWQ